MSGEVIDDDLLRGASTPVVERWRRYGHDRAYVEVDQRPIGYRDLLTGRIHAEDPVDIAMIERATAAVLDSPEWALTSEDEREADGRHGNDDESAAPADPDAPYVPRHAAPEASALPLMRAFRKRNR